MKPVSSFGREGFTLVEAIAGMVLFTLMMAALTYGTATLFKSQSQPSVAYNGQIYALAPSFGEFNKAVTFHQNFVQAMDQADSILVLGGQRSHPTLDPVGPSSALNEGFADTTLAAASGSDAFQGFASWDQREINATQFDPYLTTSPDPADFTILTVQGQSRITSITQHRRYTATINSVNVVLYEATYQMIDWSSGAPVFVPNPATGTTPTSSYRIYYAANEDTWQQPPGATHFWYRTDPAWDRDQEGPARVIFADPFVLAGQDAQAQVTSVSQFAYFVPQQR
jgi:hypothetical protein